jgi:hypothetical protein
MREVPTPGQVMVAALVLGLVVLAVLQFFVALMRHH